MTSVYSGFYFLLSKKDNKFRFLLMVDVKYIMNLFLMKRLPLLFANVRQLYCSVNRPLLLFPFCAVGCFKANSLTTFSCIGLTYLSLFLLSIGNINKQFCIDSKFLVKS
jgi:hypothetical protein